MKMSSLSSSTKYALLAAALSTLESALGLLIEKDFNPDQPRDESGKFTSGGGGGSAEEQPMPAGPVPMAMRESLVKETIAKMDLSGEITYKIMPAGENIPVIVGGVNIGDRAADYDPETGEIRIFDGAFSSEDELKGILAHEVQHHIFHSVEERYHDELVAIVEAPESPVRASGALKPEYVNQYPVYNQLYEFRELTNERVRKADGITEYSKSYWTKEALSKNFSWPRAINETLAEVARLGSIGRYNEVPSFWKKYYKAYLRSYKFDVIGK